ncbi:Lrp/AsnC family transcriptional regulator [Streptacidiphilus sp. PAMC 29251]
MNSPHDSRDLLDTVDTAILRELQLDGRIPNKALAARVGIAPSTCLDRTARLQRLGVVTGFRATVSPGAIGRGVEALLAIQFLAHKQPLVNPFIGFARSLPETRLLLHVTGSDDFLVHVNCADTADLRRLVLEFTARREVGRVHTQLIFESWQGGPQLPPTGNDRRPDRPHAVS